MGKEEGTDSAEETQGVGSVSCTARGEVQQALGNVSLERL